jgi:hypothetical protein
VQEGRKKRNDVVKISAIKYAKINCDNKEKVKVFNKYVWKISQSVIASFVLRKGGRRFFILF